MTKDDGDPLVVVGVLAGAHGVRGDVRVKSFTAEPEDLFGYGDLLDEEGRVLLEPVRVRPAKAHFIVTPKSPRSREDWDGLKGTRLLVPRSAFPPPEDDEVYIGDLIGLDAQTPDGEPVGRVKSVQNFGAGDLLEIQPQAGGKSVFIPFTETDVPAYDIEAGTLVIASWEEWSGAD